MSDTNAYTDLIAGWHVDKPKYLQTVFETTNPFAEIAAVISGLPAAFDLDDSVGAQLDAVGARVGVGRRVRAPLTGVYFSFDDAATGFDLGVWQGMYDPDSGVSMLDDETYRTVIRAKIAANQWDGTNQGAKAVLDIVFTNGAKVLAEDNQDMSMTIGISGVRPTPILTALLTNGYLSVKPAGVRIAYYITTTADGPLFGFDVDSDSIAGFDSGAFGAISTGDQ